MRKKLSSFILGLLVFVGSMGLATKSLLMNLPSVSSYSSYSSDSSDSADNEKPFTSHPRRVFASSEDKKLIPLSKEKI